MALPALAADTNPGWYVGGDIGLAIGTNQGTYANGNGVVNNYNSGFAGGIFGGYSFANGWRPEAEFGYRTQGLSKVSVISQNGAFAPTNDFSGRLSVETFMVDGWYDFRSQDGLFSTIYPYAGAGIGFAEVKISNEQNGFSAANLVNGSGAAPAFQIGFGGNWDIVPNFAASLDFRYLMSTDYKVNGDIDGGVEKLSGRLREPEITVGLKYKFGGQT